CMRMGGKEGGRVAREALVLALRSAILCSRATVRNIRIVARDLDGFEVFSALHLMRLLVIFFFSSRRRHTRLVSDWSSDVCSSDLLEYCIPQMSSADRPPLRSTASRRDPPGFDAPRAGRPAVTPALALKRSEERRVGKECRSRGGSEH